MHQAELLRETEVIGSLTMAAPLTCTDLHAVLSVEEESVSVLCVSRCGFSTTLESL